MDSVFPVSVQQRVHQRGGHDSECVHIGDGAIVVACSVVSRDVEPYTIVGGNPAQLRKRRFDPELTGLLLRLRWWDMEPERLLEWLPLLCDPDLEKLRRALQKELKDRPQEAI